jgi:NAD(P)H-quinone oxidoreductase subunit 5
LGDRQAKTRRSPEVNFWMAIPMVSFIILTILVPIALNHWNLMQLSPGVPLETGSPLLKWGSPLILLSGFSGVMIGALIPLLRTGARSMNPIVRFSQDLLAYDFYIDRIYRVTIVWLVSTSSKLAVLLDRYIIDGLVNFTGWATIFSGQALRYSVSGQSQFYVLTILICTGLLVFLASTWHF